MIEKIVDFFKEHTSDILAISIAGTATTYIKIFPKYFTLLFNVFDFIKSIFSVFPSPLDSILYYAVIFYLLWVVLGVLRKVAQILLKAA